MMFVVVSILIGALVAMGGAALVYNWTGSLAAWAWSVFGFCLVFGVVLGEWTYRRDSRKGGWM